ncbi:MAG: nicotinamide mononucleotide transporter family protein [Rickettsiales bacterium]|jgi:nicotinamide riboside transporter PnuC|nr:nicotinamide mononucleotide transporter family protein [Rickettsiales bacterium]
MNKFYMFLQIIEYYILIAGILYTTGSVMQKRWSWLCLMSYSPILVGLSIHKHLYMNSLLYIYFFYSGVRGWIKWGKNKKGGVNKVALTPSFASRKKQIIVASASFVVFILMCIFHPSNHIVEASFVTIVLDSIVFVLKTSSMYFKTSKNIEGNALMAIGNGIATIMFIERGLITSSGLYIYSFIVSSIGTYTWYKEYKRNKIPENANVIPFTR